MKESDTSTNALQFVGELEQRPISNSFQCLCALVKMQFEYAKLETTHKIEIDEQKEIIWVKKK